VRPFLGLAGVRNIRVADQEILTIVEANVEEL